MNISTGHMGRKANYITVSALLKIFLDLGLLTPEEYKYALKTLILPRDILDRLKRLDLASKN